MKPPGESLHPRYFLKMRTLTNISNYETLWGISNSMGLLENKNFDKCLNYETLWGFSNSMGLLENENFAKCLNYETLDSLTLWDFLKMGTLTNISNYETPGDSLTLWDFLKM